MKVDVVMPQMGESVVESTITKWYKNVGERVERDEELLELSADKVDADVPSPVSGVIVEILHQAGETVEVNSKIAVIETEGDAAVDMATASSAAEKTPSDVSQPRSCSQSQAPSQGKPHTAKVDHTAKRSPITGLSSADRSVLSAEELRLIRSTPLVRKIAAEHGIDDLSLISGTGIGGRVTRDDILSYISSAPDKPSTAREEVLAPATSCGHRQASEKHTISREIPPLPPVKVYPNDRVETLSPQRQAIARHMLASRATSPHAHTIHEVDFSAVVRSRKAKKREFEERGVRLTFTSYLVKAVAQALVEFPAVNCSLDGNDLILRGDVNVGIAVDIGDSLVVPVIKHADELSLIGISRAIDDLATRARSKKLTPEDMQAGTFTVSNHGIFGPEFGIPIINQPQAAIMSTGAIKKRVVVDQKTDAIMVRPTSLWCLSFDHRAIDGAMADKFMARLREIIETWSD